MRFVGPTIGFAVQSTGVGDHQLLRTTDGHSWAPAGTVGQHRTDYQFTSADVGFYTAGTDIFRTGDGGRKWERVYQCRIKAEINGLTRDVNCQFAQMSFVDATVGYAMSQTIGGAAGLVMAKTEDGGTTWMPWIVLPGEDGKEGALHFMDANTGVMRAGANRACGGVHDARESATVHDPRHHLGRLGERLALEHLERLGYRLVVAER